MKNRSGKLRIMFAALSVMLACVLLGSCSALESCVDGCSLLRSIYEPELKLIGETGSEIPVIENSLNAEKVSSQLYEYYLPIAQIVRSANGEEQILSLRYEMTRTEDSFTLSSAIDCLAGGSIALPDVVIPYSGALRLAEHGSLDFLADGGVAKAYFALVENGFEVDSSRLDDELSKAELCRMMLDYYELVSGMRPDTSRFVDSMEVPAGYKEAFTLGLCYSEYDYDLELVNQDDLLDLSAALLSALYNDACGCGSRNFTNDELLGAVLALLDMVGSGEDEEWSARRDSIENACLTGMSDAQEELTRRAVAQTLVAIYENVCAEITGGDGTALKNAAEYITDTDDLDCLKAYSINVLSDFPSAAILGENYTPSYNEAPEFARDFLRACRWYGDDWTWDEEDNITYGELIVALAGIDGHVRAIGTSTGEYFVVNNSRDYNWYFAQYGTGSYSEVNCMPTIAMMAIKWYNRNTQASVQKLRGLFLPDYQEGWYMWQVMDCLAEYDVPYTQGELEENMLDYLDAGNIILTQMSEAADGRSGHCFIIYGYEQKGETIRFFVHDPGVWDGTDECGRRPGEALVLDSGYCNWIISRIAFYYVVVG